MSALDRLAAELGGAPPGELSQLSDTELDDLTAAVAAARRDQAEALARAGADALKAVPRPLRGAVRKVVGL